MAEADHIKIDVEVGPVIRTALDVLEFSMDLAADLSEGPHKDELNSRLRGLMEICHRLLEEGLN